MGRHVISFPDVSVGVITRSLSNKHIENKLTTDTREKVFDITLKNPRKVRGKAPGIIKLVQSKGIVGFEKTLNLLNNK